MKYIVNPIKRRNWFCHCTNCTSDCGSECSSKCSNDCDHSSCNSGYTVNT